MKSKNIIKDIRLFIAVIVSLVVLDYINLPSLLGFEMSNINWDFCMGIFNIIVVIVLYSITYKKLDKRTIEREKNKNEISSLLIKECYHECIEYIALLNQETIEKYIVPKIDFNNTTNKNMIIGNLQNSPFVNENIIMDLVKDGQITKKQIDGYFKVKKKYRQYINMRIIFFDCPNLYEPLKTDLCNLINIENKKLDNQL